MFVSRRSTLRTTVILAGVALALTPLVTRAQDGYRQPPAAVAQILDADVRVDLGTGDALVPEKPLKLEGVAALGKHVPGEVMPESVGGAVALGYPGLLARGSRHRAQVAGLDLRPG